jgi:putative flippase GtrA
MKIISLLERKIFKFLFLGIVNTLLTNLLLQICLFLFSTVLATFLSQMFNFLFGYHFYSTKVFKVGSHKFSFFMKYIFVVLVSWNIIWITIDYLYSLGISKNLTAILIIPPLALFSYCMQKYFVFKN